MFKHIFTVWRKELSEAFRDRRSLIMTIVVPLVIMPIFVLGPSYLMRSQEAEQAQAVQEIVIVNGTAAPSLVAALQANSGLKIVEKTDSERAVQEGKLALFVIVPAEFERKLANAEQTTLAIKFNPTKSESRIARDKLHAILEAYRKELVSRRLESHGLSPKILEPFATNYQSVASQEQFGGFVLGLILPLFLLLWATLGGAQTAIDVTVGEKERKTLEALLVTPPRRESLVLGKILAVFTMTVLSALVSIIGFLISLRFGGMLLGGAQLRNLPLADLSVSFSPLVALTMFAVMAGIAAMSSALIFAIFAWTRSLREAQSHSAWLTFAVMIPAIAVQFREFTPSFELLLIPLFNATLVFKELLVGQLNWLNIGVTLASLLVYALLSVVLAVRVFQNERVLFRQ